MGAITSRSRSCRTIWAASRSSWTSIAPATINTVIAADRPQTLDLLRRDAGGLERALQDAGFKTDGSSPQLQSAGRAAPAISESADNPGPAAWQSPAGEEAERSYRPTYRIASTADAIRAAADGRVNIAV